MEKEALAELLKKDLIIGYVYGLDGERQEYYFEKSPSGIASFIMLKKEHADKMILTDTLDRLVLDTYGEFIISHEQAEAVREIFEYRRKQMGVDDLEKYQSRYAFSSKILCGECGGLFRRQKIYIGKPYEKIQWCCRQHIFEMW